MRSAVRVLQSDGVKTLAGPLGRAATARLDDRDDVAKPAGLDDQRLRRRVREHGRVRLVLELQADDPHHPRIVGARPHDSVDPDRRSPGVGDPDPEAELRVRPEPEHKGRLPITERRSHTPVIERRFAVGPPSESSAERGMRCPERNAARWPKNDSEAGRDRGDENRHRNEGSTTHSSIGRTSTGRVRRHRVELLPTSRPQ